MPPKTPTIPQANLLEEDKEAVEQTLTPLAMLQLVQRHDIGQHGPWQQQRSADAQTGNGTHGVGQKELTLLYKDHDACCNGEQNAAQVICPLQHESQSVVVRQWLG
jgi:hypothetical protein